MNKPQIRIQKHYNKNFNKNQLTWYVIVSDLNPGLKLYANEDYDLVKEKFDYIQTNGLTAYIEDQRTDITDLLVEDLNCPEAIQKLQEIEDAAKAESIKNPLHVVKDDE